MIRYVLLLGLFFFASDAFGYVTCARYGSKSATECARSTIASKIYQIAPHEVQYDGYWAAFVTNDGDPVDYDYSLGPVYNHVYTDDQCQSLYGGQQTFAATSDEASSGFTMGGGACGVAAIDGVMASWTAGGVDYTSAEYMSVSSGSVGVNQAGVEEEQPLSSDYETPEYMTENAACEVDCVTIDGVKYEIDQTAIDDGTVSVIGSGDTSEPEPDPITTDFADGSSRTDYPDGSFDITAADGTTTSYTSSGGLKSPGSATSNADGEDYGDGDDGIIKALSALKKSIGEGFEGLVDDLTEDYDDASDVAAIDKTIADYETTRAEDTTIQEVDDKVDAEINEDLGNSVIAGLPSFFKSGFGCSDISVPVLGREMTIKCSQFQIFRDMFAFMIYVFTALSIVELFFSSSRPRGA